MQKINRYDAYFEYAGNVLSCEGVDLRELAKEFGTPLYVYTERGFRDRFRELDSALAGMEHLICYSVKTNNNLSLIRIMGEMGSGVDVVSGGELFRALKAGIPAERIVFAGVGKTAEEIAYAIDSGILMFNCESFQEIEEIDRISREKGRVTDIAVRVNPDVDADTHHYITTGKKENKFGITIEQLLAYLPALRRLWGVSLKGLHAHIGSQILSVSPFLETVDKFVALTAELRGVGFDSLRCMNLGGGLGIVYNDETPFDTKAWAAGVMERVKPLGLKLIIEPGRYISGNNGALVVRVTYKKRGDAKIFLITDGGMNDLIRPSLYGAYQQVVNCLRRDGTEKADIVGPVCESGDFFAKDREITITEQGDHLAVLSAGAYCMAMASRYNARRLPAEVLVTQDGKIRLIRRRDTYEEMAQNEVF